MKRSAFEKTTKNEEGEVTHHAFQPVTKRQAVMVGSEREDYKLRRSARMNGKSSKRKNRIGSSFQHSDSYQDQSGSDSHNDSEESENENVDANPHKKKLVFLSKRVYEKAREHRVTNGTNIAREILEESRKLKMNFDFKNVQRRVYDALNVLTALDMIKKDRNKIEFTKDVNEVFGEGSKEEVQSPLTKTDQDLSAKIKYLKDLKASKLEELKVKRQYFDEITVQVSLLKRLVRRNYKVEDEDTNANTPDKPKVDSTSIEKYHKTKKIHLPILVLEFTKDADFEILMNEDHNKVVIFSDTH